MATKITARQRVKEILGMAQTNPLVESGSPSNAEIDELVTEARQFVFLELTHLFPERVSTTTTVTYTAGAESKDLALPHSNQMISEVMANEYGQTARSKAYLLEAIQPGEFPLYDRTGMPRFYHVENGLIFLRPIPPGATTLHITSVGDVDTSEDDEDFPETPIPYHHMYAWHAAAQYKKLAGDPDASVIESSFERVYSSLLKHYERMVPDQGFASYRPRRW